MNEKKMKNTLPFGLVIVIILLSSISCSQAKAVSKSIEDGTDDDDYNYSEDDGNNSQEPKFMQNIAETKNVAMEPAATVGIANSATTTKKYKTDIVKDLKLDGTLVDPVKYTCPTDCQCSEGTLVVNCSNRSLTQIPNGIPKNVHKLILSDNWLDTIKANAFSELTELKEIILAKNQIKSIDSNAFTSQLGRLDHIDLSSNQLTKLDPDIFVILPKLKKLALNNNNLTIVEDEVLLKQPILEDLNLVGCNISKVYESTFVGLTGLQRLQLANNPLEEEMDLNSFDPIVKLQNLSMPDLDQDTIFQLCQKLISIDVINFDTFDMSCYELVLGQTFEDSVVTIKTTTRNLGTRTNDIEMPLIVEQDPSNTERMVAQLTEEPVTARATFKVDQVSSSMVSDARKDTEISLSDTEVNTSATHNTTSDQDEPPIGVSNISTETINKMLIGIIIIAVCGLVIGVICRRDCFGIKTKMCRTRRSLPTDRTNIRPSEEVPLNKITNDRQQ